MKTTNSLERAAVVIAAALLSACTGSQVAPAAGPALLGARPVARSGALADPRGAAPSSGKSWILRSATRCGYNGKLPPCGLLYVTNYHANDVIIYQNDQVVGELKGLKGPDGICTDRHGNVWIVNNLGQDVVEYAHGGTTPRKTLGDPGYYPLGCAVNPRTGALVVTNIFSTSSGPGNIAIYHKAQGPPLILDDPKIFYYFFAGFDADSNLYVDGLDTSQTFVFAELLRGQQKFNKIALNGTIYYPGAIAWDGTYVDIGDQRYQNQVASAIYQTTGAGGKIVGTTVMNGAQDVVGYWLGAGTVIAPDANLNDVSLYQYPAGGDPALSIGNLDQPYGAAVSVGRSNSASPALAKAPRPLASPAYVAPRGPKARGWISHDAAGQRLVYITDGDQVLIFPERRNKPPVGQITDGIESAYGICFDRNGNLYVANQYDDNVVEYPPGATEPSQSFSQDLQRPLYPAVDSHGNLWVTNADNGTVVEFAAGSTQATQVLQTPGVEADGLDFDTKGDLYVAYRLQSQGSGSIEEFAPGSSQGTILGMSINQPQSVVVTNTGTILTVETGGTNRIDVFPPGYQEPTLEVGVRDAPTQIAITRDQRSLWVSSFSEGRIFSSPYPLLNPNGSPNVLHEKIRVKGYGIVQGMALSNGQVF
ncbi:MAG: hypothetical protein WBD57_07540 [Candidatus Cybelea sp.]